MAEERSAARGLFAAGSPHARTPGAVADRDFVYLLPDAAFAAVQRLPAAGREPITMSSRTLWSRLHERGFLAEVDARGAERGSRSGWRWPGKRVPVLKFARGVFLPVPACGPSGPRGPAI